MKTIPNDKDLTADELKAALSEMVDKVLRKFMPPESPAFNNEKEKVVENLFQAITNKDNRNPVTFNQLADPTSANYINKIIVYAIASVLLQKNLTKDIQELFKKLKELNPDFDPTKITKLDDLKNFFNEKQLQLILTPQVTNQLKDFYKNFANDVKNTLTPLSTRPEFIRKAANELTLTEDPYVNLLGLSNSRFPGTYPVPQVTDKGNINAYVDQSAYRSSSSISDANRYDNAIGDPQGFDAEKLANFLEVPGNNLATLIDSMHQSAIHLTPTFIRH